MTADGPELQLAGGRPEHHAYLYSELATYVDDVTAYVRDGLERSDAVLVATPTSRLAALRDVLPVADGDITYVDMATTGPNPARLFPMWHEFIDRAARAGRAVTGVGEPALPGRTDEVYGEIARNEAVTDRALAGRLGCQVLCPYDTSTLPEHVIDDVERTHREVRGQGRPDDARVPFEAERAITQLDDPLPQPPDDAESTVFGARDYPLVRALVAARAQATGLSDDCVDDLVLAVHELATNAVRHGSGSARLTTWSTPTALLVDVSGGGRFTDPLVGRVHPDLVGESGRGLWLANQLCDLVQLRNTAEGTVARVHTLRP